ncbi:BQ2448_657 [Microbotryum intermedium]|uniref:BQ2448_657 protein n=1 Tax=Microbotryum intermedium TaxID=269621 RepID=A0A238FBT3_9BASI|nr:BQ2448_657 [Microbotryum intermedium]
MHGRPGGSVQLALQLHFAGARFGFIYAAPYYVIVGTRWLLTPVPVLPFTVIEDGRTHLLVGDFCSQTDEFQQSSTMGFYGDMLSPFL